MPLVRFEPAIPRSQDTKPVRSSHECMYTLNVITCEREGRGFMYTVFVFSYIGLEMTLLLVGKLSMLDMLPGVDHTL